MYGLFLNQHSRNGPLVCWTEMVLNLLSLATKLGNVILMSVFNQVSEVNKQHEGG